jgi:HSP20 family protein
MAGSTLDRWSPFADFGDLPLHLDRLFEGFSGPDGHWGPAMDVIREDERFVLKVDLPGITIDEVKIEVEDGVLTVSGEHEEKLDDEKDQYVRRERHYGSFYRSMLLPPSVTPEQIKATCKDGVLEVTVPIPKPEKKAVTITPPAD